MLRFPLPSQRPSRGPQPRPQMEWPGGASWSPTLPEGYTPAAPGPPPAPVVGSHPGYTGQHQPARVNPAAGLPFGGRPTGLFKDAFQNALLGTGFVPPAVQNELNAFWDSYVAAGAPGAIVAPLGTVPGAGTGGMGGAAGGFYSAQPLNGAFNNMAAHSYFNQLSAAAKELLKKAFDFKPGEAPANKGAPQGLLPQPGMVGTPQFGQGAPSVPPVFPNGLPFPIPSGMQLAPWGAPGGTAVQTPNGLVWVVPVS